MNGLELGDNLMLYSAIVGAMLPALVAAINRREWSSEVKGVVAAAVSILAGAGTAVTSGHWDGSDVMRSVLIVFFLGQMAYAQFWKPSGIADDIEGR